MHPGSLSPTRGLSEERRKHTQAQTLLTDAALPAWRESRGGHALLLALVTVMTLYGGDGALIPGKVVHVKRDPYDVYIGRSRSTCSGWIPIRCRLHTDSTKVSFREAHTPEAQFPRRTLLGFSVNGGNGSPLAPGACSLASTDGYLFAKRAGKSCLEVLSSTSSRKKKPPSKYFEGVSGGGVHSCAGRIGRPRRKTYNLFYSYPTYDAGRRTLEPLRPGAVRQQAGPTSQDLHRRSWGGLSPPSFLV